MKRDPLGKFFVVALVLAALGMAAVTRFPDSRWADILARAAVFGPWIERLAQLYRKPLERPETEFSDLEGGVEIIYQIDAGRGEAVATILVPAATPLFAQPPEVLGQVTSPPSIASTPAGESTRVELFGRRGDWYEVEYGGEKGWVFLSARPSSLESETSPLPAARQPSLEDKAPPLGSEPALALPLPSRPPNPEVLAVAIELLAGKEGRTTLGPYTLHTDVEDKGLLVFLSALAAQLESVYAGRYDLEARTGAREAVVLFASESDYLQFVESLAVSTVTAPGVLHAGVVATYAGGRGWSEVAGTLIHELTHLLNRRALGPALPPWLEEGLADDLAQSRIEGLRILPGTLGGSSVRTGVRTEYKGGRAAVIELGRALSGSALPPLETLVTLDWDAFQSDQRSQRYAHSSFFIRSLLDSSDPELAAAFRGFLRDVSEGRPVAAEVLLRQLGQSWQDLDARLASFVRRQADEAGLPISSESGSSSRHASEPSS